MRDGRWEGRNGAGDWSDRGRSEALAHSVVLTGVLDFVRQGPSHLHLLGCITFILMNGYDVMATPESSRGHNHSSIALIISNPLRLQDLSNPGPSCVRFWSRNQRIYMVQSLFLPGQRI